MTTNINVNDLSGPELITKYNELATAVGRPTVTRFATLTKGRARLERMLAELEIDQAAQELGAMDAGDPAPVLTESEVEQLVEQSNTEAQQTDAYLATLAEQADDGTAPEGDDDGIPHFLRREPVASTVAEQEQAALVADGVSPYPTTPAAELDAAVPLTLAEQAVEAIQGGDAAAFIAAAAEAPVNQPKPTRKQGGGGKAGVGTGPGGETLKAQQERYNQLATEARSLGLKAKHHTSTFERHADGERVIAKLQAQVNEAKAKQPAEQVG